MTARRRPPCDSCSCPAWGLDCKDPRFVPPAEQPMLEEAVPQEQRAVDELRVLARSARGEAQAFRHLYEELAGFARWAAQQGGEVAERARAAQDHETRVSQAGIASCSCERGPV